MENKQPNPKTTEELDLSQFFRMVNRSFNSMANAILMGIALLRNLFFQNLKFFAITMALGVVVGAIYSRLLRTEYFASSMVLNCAVFNNQIMKTHIDELSHLCIDPERKELSRVLGISDTIAKQILKFEFEPFVTEKEIVELEVLKEQLTTVAEEKKELIDKIVNRINIENKDAFKITVFVSNPTAILHLQEPIVKYFENNQYIKRRLDVHKMMRQERKNKLTRESRSLDSLKTLIYENLAKVSKNDRGFNNIVFDDKELNDPLDVFREDLALNTQILQLESELFLRPDFEVIDGFTVFNKPASPSLLKIVAISLAASFVACYLILFARRFDRMLSQLPIR